MNTGQISFDSKAVLNISSIKGGDVNLARGEVVSGVVKQVNENGLIVINIKGKNIEAVSEVPVQEGQKLYLSVDDVRGGKTYLKVMTPELMEKMESGNIQANLRNMNVVANDASVQMARKLIQYQLPVTEKNLNELSRMVNILGGRNAQNMEIAAFAMSRGIPATAENMQALKLFITQKSDSQLSFLQISSALADQLEAAAETLGRATTTASGPATTGSATGTVSGMVQEPVSTAPGTATGTGAQPGVPVGSTGPGGTGTLPGTAASVEGGTSASVTTQSQTASSASPGTATQPVTAGSSTINAAATPAGELNTPAGPVSGNAEEASAAAGRSTTGLPGSTASASGPGSAATAATAAATTTATAAAAAGDGAVPAPVPGSVAAGSVAAPAGQAAVATLPGALAAGTSPETEAGPAVTGQPGVPAAAAEEATASPAQRSGSESAPAASTGAAAGQSALLDSGSATKTSRLLVDMFRVLNDGASLKLDSTSSQIASDLQNRILGEKDLIKGLMLLKQMIGNDDGTIRTGLIQDVFKGTEKLESDLSGQRLFNFASRAGSDINASVYYFSIPVKYDDEYRMMQLKLSGEGSRKGFQDPEHLTVAVSLDTQNMGIVIYHLDWYKKGDIIIQGLVQSQDAADHMNSEMRRLVGILTEMGYNVSSMGVKVSKVAEEAEDLKPRLVETEETVRPFGIDVKV